MKKYFLILTYSIILYSGNLYAQIENLNYYIKIAVENSQEIKAKSSEIAAAKENINGKSALQDAEFGVNILPESMMNVNGEQIATLSLMQMFPFPGTLSNQRKEMQCMTDGLSQTKKKITADLIYKVKSAYYEMVLLNEQIKITEQKSALLKQTTESAYQKYASANPNSNQKSLLPVLINLQLKAEELNLNLETLKDNLAVKKKAFNVLLHRDENLSIKVADSVVEDMYDADAFTFEKIENMSPMLAMLRADSKASMHAVEMQKRMSLPMIGVGVEYMINKETAMPKMEDMNGKNMFMAMFKVSLPLNRKKFNSNIAAAKLKSESIASNYEQTKDNIKAEFLNLQQNYLNEKKKIALYERQMQLIEENIKILNVSYANNQASVTDLFSIEEKLLDYKLKKASAVANINKIIAKLQTMVSDYEEI